LLMTPELDSAFNLTSTYLQKSDSIRRFGEIENSIFNEDWETTVRRVMGSKQKYNQPVEKFGAVYNSLWYVSNCDHTEGAKKRFEYGQKLIKAGLRLHGEGECFENPTQRRFGRSVHGAGNLTKKQRQQMTAPVSTFPVHKMKFYLAFENAYHCNDYIRKIAKIFFFNFIITEFKIF